jgi:predicted lactoylglutathione lyase
MTIGSTSEFSAQLVLEILVHDLARSLAFYESIGFKLERRSEKFAVVR